MMVYAARDKDEAREVARIVEAAGWWVGEEKWGVGKVMEEVLGEMGL